MMYLMVFLGILAGLGLLSYLLFYYKSQIFGKMLWRIPTDQKLIALTFDDGPNQPFTTQIAKILEKYDSRGTFFIVGKNCEKYPNIVLDLYNNGHEIGIHSYSHMFTKYFTDPLFINEIQQTNKILISMSIRTKLLRFPWLFRTPWLLKSVKKLGFIPVSGQFSHMLEPAQPDAAKTLRRIKNIVKPGLILIFHDGYDAKGGDRRQTVRSVEMVCKYLESTGYKMVTVSQLIQSAGKNS